MSEYKNVLSAPAVFGGPPRENFKGRAPSERVSLTILDDIMNREASEGWSLHSVTAVQSWGEPALLLTFTRAALERVEGPPPEVMVQLTPDDPSDEELEGRAAPQGEREA